MENKLTPLRFIVLLDSQILKKWQVESIQSLVNSDHAVCQEFIINEGEASYKRVKLSLGYRFIDRSIRGTGPLETIDITSQFSEVPRTSCTPIVKGHSNYFPEETITHINELQADFILRFGFGILKGEILTAAKHGVWSFHHGDPFKFRGGPAAFWEIYNKEATTGAILQRITKKLDSGFVLRSGTFKTISHSYQESLHHVLESTQEWPLLVVKDILYNGNEEVEKIQSNAPIYKAPSNLQVLRFYFKLFKNRLKLNYRQLFLAEFWKVGIIEKPIHSVLSEKLGEVKWIESSDSNTYWADCFAYSDTEFLVEEYDYSTEKGTIQKVDVKGNSQALLETNTHLSYPFTIQHEGSNYLLPENYKNKSLLLYKLVDQQWTSSQLLDGEWIDPTLIFYNNKWWLFCTSSKAPNEDLHLFFSDKIDGDYTAHPLNPIIQNVENSRPAGTLFIQNNELYRPAQKSANTYGECVQINKITTLSTTDFKEEWIKSISPKEFDQKLEGLHTISSFGNRTLVDVKVTAFNFKNFKNQISHKLKRIF